MFVARKNHWLSLAMNLFIVLVAIFIVIMLNGCENEKEPSVIQVTSNTSAEPFEENHEEEEKESETSEPTNTEESVTCMSNNDCSTGEYCTNNGECLDSNLGYGIEDYPIPFIENSNLRVTFVVGENAPAEDTLAVLDIAARLTEETGDQNVNTVLASDVDDPNDENLILVGSPCDNALVEDIFSVSCEDWTYGANEAVISLAHNGEKLAMLVAGGDGDATRMAAKVLASYDGFEMCGEQVIVIGSSLELEDISTFSDCGSSNYVDPNACVVDSDCDSGETCIDGLCGIVIVDVSSYVVDSATLIALYTNRVGFTVGVTNEEAGSDDFSIDCSLEANGEIIGTNTISAEGISQGSSKGYYCEIDITDFYSSFNDASVEFELTVTPTDSSSYGFSFFVLSSQFAGA